MFAAKNVLHNSDALHDYLQTVTLRTVKEENTTVTNQPVPAGVAGCYVVLLGGGGGGHFGGGGGGSRVEAWVPVASLGSSYSTTRGLGGNQSAGGNSVFTSGAVTLTAGGGAAGTAMTGGIATAVGVSGAICRNGKSGGPHGWFAPATPGTDDTTDNVGAGGGGSGYNGAPGRGGNSMTRNGTPASASSTPIAAEPGNGGAGGGGGDVNAYNYSTGGLYGGGGGGNSISTGGAWGGAGGHGYISVEWRWNYA